MVRQQVDTVDALMAHYVAGSLPEPARILVEAHLELKSNSRRFVRSLETLAGAALENEPLVPVLDRRTRLASIFGSTEPVFAAPTVLERPAGAVFPAILREFVGVEAEQIPWKTKLPGFKEYDIGTIDGCEVGLMWIRPGRALPAHTHRGVELILIIDGAFTDSRGRFDRGDISVADEHLDHRPIADKDRPCIAFSVNDAPIKLTGKLTQLIGDLIG